MFSHGPLAEQIRCWWCKAIVKGSRTPSELSDGNARDEHRRAKNKNYQHDERQIHEPISSPRFLSTWSPFVAIRVGIAAPTRWAQNIMT